MPVLTGVDILGIQSYVFSSNRLRDVLAASWMVEHVTSPNMLTQWGIPDDSVLLSAGGNAILEFATPDDAFAWTARYTRWLHDTAPGLELVVAHREYTARSLAWALKALQIDLARSKMVRLPSAPQLGLGVTASCSVTGMPATDVDRGELISLRIKALRDNREVARSRWDAFVPALRVDSANFANELDQMGRTPGDTSTLGVVHVDGNSVGVAITSWLDRCVQNDIDNHQVRTEYRAWSKALCCLGEQVLRAVIQRVGARVDQSGSRPVLRGTPADLSFALRGDDENVLLPLHPILLGGDDLTFVCDGRIALDLAAAALEEFSKHPIPHLGEDGTATILSACSGVALVKPHAPFHRSYELAEALCASAKSRRRTTNDQVGVDTGSWLDWHVGTPRPGETVESIRLRQYQRGDSMLTLRPYPLEDIGGRQGWRWLDRDVLGPDTHAEHALRGFVDGGAAKPNEWSGSRNRVKLLDQLIVEGRDAVKRQLEAWRTIECGIQLPGGLHDTGFVGSETPLLDAIELLDIHLQLTTSLRNDEEVC